MTDPFPPNCPHCGGALLTAAELLALAAAATRSRAAGIPRLIERAEHEALRRQPVSDNSDTANEIGGVYDAR